MNNIVLPGQHSHTAIPHHSTTRHGTAVLLAAAGPTVQLGLFGKTLVEPFPKAQGQQTRTVLAPSDFKAPEGLCLKQVEQNGCRHSGIQCTFTEVYCAFAVQ